MKGKDGTNQCSALHLKYSASQYKQWIGKRYSALQCNTVFTLKVVMPKIYSFLKSNMSYFHFTEGPGQNISVVILQFDAFIVDFPFYEFSSVYSNGVF